MTTIEPKTEEQARIAYLRTLLNGHKMNRQQLVDLGYADAAINAAEGRV